MYVPGLGERVSRPATALTLQGTQDLFNITGGAIQMRYLVGRVESLLGTTGAGTLLLRYSEVAAASVTNFCTAVSVEDDPVGTFYICEGQPNNPLIKVVESGGGAGHIVQGGWLGGDMDQVADEVANGWICGAGIIQCVLAVSDLDGTGTVSWEMFYIPLEEGVAVAAG